MDNDENAKIIFRDHNIFKGNSDTVESTNFKIYNNKELRKEVSAHNIIQWPDEKEFNNSDIAKHVTEDQIHAAPTVDQFVFQFPAIDKAHKLNNEINASQSSPIPAIDNNNFNNNSTNNTVLYNDKVTFALYYKEKLSENVCTYMKKSDCYQNKGALNVDMKDEKKYTLNRQLICCILPIKNNENVVQSNKVSFPEVTKNLRRFKRSKSTALGKGNILLFHNYSNKKQKTKQPAMTTDEDYEYEDPYVNIKNHKSPHNRKQESMTKHDNSDEYPDDYAVEIPAPGLTGLYSDIHEIKDNPYNVQHIATPDYEDEDRTDSLGYATVNPRIGYNKKRKSPYNKPLKLTTNSDEIYDIDSQTISYHSEPNFNVLQDFKLPNLTRKKVIKTTRSTTTESFSNDHIEDVNKNEESDNIAALTVNTNNVCDHRQIFKDCGRTFNPITMQNKEMGDTEKASHPWLAILVPTHKENKLICYASLIHPRAAITAGDCVHRTAPGEITLIAALWNLSERSRSGKRVVIPLLHPQYKSDDLNNNLALVHWKKPLKLGATVIPICLASPKFDDECMFVGWGGFDQPIRTQSRWQRATIQNCKDHSSLAGIPIPINAFCASVETRSTVTGIGGSLVCKTDGHLSAVGVAVSRDSTLILLPMYNWLTSPHIGTFIGFPDK
ncbi:unnamed protein product [Arctia plantaginis]|uniref:Peptidase S1 domain-containing protein n=1 Tax=Arctia plantaginis TaxID=874455 RepID=A0A8S1BFU7_ARCPL|nr:unnamed protein product [Arctia plantaginis]